ncbi:hypothetical protein CAP31_10070 [Sulfuriferula sp. AH1]|uniref:DUF2339 domain-containing protein n=1 Tax=Sulfuriferula sp. AH1 TaxID=1985873 RepID=UPI000B3B130A|nr:DUF2339 domain-containing protein [Sulfuriferula sp. AH1]ARU31993.1 hypothetical protein CAP31_10070 [Sulfuriferula sp. AH1]
MAEVDERLTSIESRLTRLEQLLQTLAARTESPEPAPLAQAASAAAMRPTLTKKPVVSHTHDNISVTNILGWTGATALVLAAAYLIRLAIDSGWLTPERQIALAVLGGFALIGIGLALRKSDKNYASLLPAGGLVVLFMSTYGAHLYYHLIGAHTAVGAVILICLGALWLGRLFESELYALFAVTGSYSAPFLLPNLTSSVTDLVIYFSAWSVLFSIYSIWIGKRRVYLLASYMALLGFNAIWTLTSPDSWVEALVFQAAQFIIFLVGAVTFSIKRNSPMDQNAAIAHLPLLLIFYALQYSLLQHNLPDFAPWIAIGSAAVLLAGYLVAKHVIKAPLQSGSILVGAYAALVLFHAGYLESVPAEWAPWVALSLLPVLAGYFLVKGELTAIVWPLRLTIGVIFVINYLRVLAEDDLHLIPAHDLLALIYALQLYAGYYFARRIPALIAFDSPLLYAGHIALMSAAYQVFDGRLTVSFAWGIIGISCLAIALGKKDKILGKSSLLIFAISAAKVLLFDLSDAAPLIRIACLFVLGVTLYAGGWMYRKVDAMEQPARFNN